MLRYLFIIQYNLKKIHEDNFFNSHSRRKPNFFDFASTWSGQGYETISVKDEWNGNSSDEFGMKRN